MPVLGVTGSIATGKSTACRLTAIALNAKVFDADAIVRELLAKDPMVQAEVSSLLGSDVMTDEGVLDRKRIQERVFSDSKARRGLESILHPRVRRIWENLVENFRSGGSSWLLLEIPLLYETLAETKMDGVIVTACCRKTQIDRLTSFRSLTKQMAERIVEAQGSQESKITRADRVLWNDSTRGVLEAQIQALAASLNDNHG